MMFLFFGLLFGGALIGTAAMSASASSDPQVDTTPTPSDGDETNIPDEPDTPDTPDSGSDRGDPDVGGTPSNPGGNNSPDPDPDPDPEPDNGSMPGGHTGNSGTPSDSQDPEPGHTGHTGHNTGQPPAPLPKTPAEIDAFVQAVRASGEPHAHDAGSSMAAEHMAALKLVPKDDATHIAIGHGDWDDPKTWHNGEVPDDDAQVLIPQGVHVTYGHVSDTELFTLRVDGHLEFADDSDSQMLVDTIVVSPVGALTIGTVDDPIPANVNVDIIFVNNGPIDTNWDPMLLSRGMIAHGKVNIHGAEKDSHEKVVTDPMKGDTFVKFDKIPEGWEVGDTIVIAGTRYEGYPRWDQSFGYEPPEDEIRVISGFKGDRVLFDDPLDHDHDTPRADLKTSVANYSRNVSFETEDGLSAEVFERGHVMFMHNNDVDVRYAEFNELGRTDKSEPAKNVSEFDDIASDSNVKGRYSFHFHRAGTEDQDDPGMAVGNAVFGSPGWGFVHHDSNAIFDNNASYDTYGAGFVAESGNETGAWTDNIAIFAEGPNWKDPKLGGNDLDNFDLGRTGDGFWFQGRMVESSGNIAASVNNGFVYFHRGDFGEQDNMFFDAAVSPISGALYHTENTFPDDHPILTFSDNETFASRNGLYVLKANPKQGHDVHSVLEDFTAWSVKIGADLSYTSHYVLKDFDIIGKDSSAHSGKGDVGILFGSNVSDMTIVNPNLENLDVGIDLFKNFTDAKLTDDLHEYAVVDANFTGVDTKFNNYDPALDTVILSADLPKSVTPDIVLNGPLTYKEGDTATEDGVREIEISGSKMDGLGVTEFPTDADDYTLDWKDVRSTLDKEGYYTTSSGQNYFMLDIYFSDRLSGDIYAETHPVLLDANVKLGEPGWYEDVPFNGVVDLGGSDDLTVDGAVLWATLTNGQPVLTDEAVEMEEELHEDVM